jgi:hypothetical protein
LFDEHRAVRPVSVLSVHGGEAATRCHGHDNRDWRHKRAA